MPDAAEVQEHEMITAISSHGDLYPIGKLDAHVRNVPHLAISIFVFNRGRLLLQQRADGKYHSGGLWANTCCSHPRWNESLEDCAARRLTEETGVSLPLEAFGVISYEAQVGKLFENETASCFVGHAQDDALPDSHNPDEIQAMRWAELEQLNRDIQDRPEHYAPWLKVYLGKHFDLIADAASKPN